MFALFDELQQPRSIDGVIAFVNIDGEVFQGRTAAVPPLLDIGVIPLRYLPVVKDAVAKLLPQDILEVAEHQLGVCQDLVQVRPQLILVDGIGSELDLAVEGDDGPEGALLGQDPQLALRIDVIHGLLDVHDLLLVQPLQVLLAEALQGSLADKRPDRLAVVEDPVRLLVLLGHVVVELDERHHDVVDHEAHSEREQSPSPRQYLAVELVVEAEAEPGRLEGIHPKQEVLHLVVLEPLHADEAIHHLQQNHLVLKAQQALRDRRFQHGNDQLLHPAVIAVLSVERVEQRVRISLLPALVGPDAPLEGAVIWGEPAVASEEHVESRCMLAQVLPKIHEIAHRLEEIEQYRRQQPNLLLTEVYPGPEVLLQALAHQPLGLVDVDALLHPLIEEYI